MNKRKKIVMFLTIVNLMFCLFSCSVIGSTNLPKFSPVDDAENVLTFYKDSDRSYYDNDNTVLFFNTKIEKVTKEWDLNAAVEGYGCEITSYSSNEVINNEVYFALNDKCYHVKKSTGENIPLKCDSISDINSFIDNKILIRNYSSDHNYIYDPKNSSVENTKFNSYYTDFFKLNGEYYYIEGSCIYSYKTGKRVYSISEQDDYYNSINTFSDTNFYTFYNSQTSSDESSDTIVKIKELREFVIDSNGDFDNALVGKLKNSRTVQDVIQNSDTQITLFEYDKNNYLYVSVYTKENSTWKCDEKITKTSDKIKVYYNTWIKAQNEAYWLKNENDNIIKINKADFTVKEIKL